MTDVTPDEQITVVIVDDHDMVAAGLQALIEDDPAISVVARGSTVEEGLVVTRRHNPQVVLMDYRLPDGNGADAARTMRDLDPAPSVVMVTSAVDRRVLSQALDAGCCGFVSKNAPRSELVEAIRCAADGESYFTRDVLKHLVHLHRFNQVESVELSNREVEVLQATANGDSVDAIASTLFISPHTVKNHLRHAMEKLDAHSKLEVVVKALRARLISVDD